MDKKTNLESGQVIMLLVFALVALFGFVALALDGGMVYSDRRLAQNAADASALAGIGKAALKLNGMVAENWSCSDSAVLTAEYEAKLAAQARASTNDFNIGLNLSAKNGVTTYCVNNGGHEKYLDVHVMITHKTKTALAHLVFGGELWNTVEAVTRLYPSFPVGEGNSIISLTYNCQGNLKGTVFGGGIDVNVTNGGGIFSNSCLILNGSSGEVKADAIWYYTDGGYTNNGMSVDPEPLDTDTHNEPEVEEPPCNMYTSKTNMQGGKNVTIDPGLYKDIKMAAADATLEMNPGLYCVEDGFEFLGQLLKGSDITIAIIGNKKGFKTSGSSEVHLSAPPADCDGGSNPGCLKGAIGGLLLYVTPSNNKDVDLMGNTFSTFSGTVYAKASEIKIGGNPALGDPDGTVDYATQVIGDTIKVAGTADVNIKYDEKQFYHTRTKLEVAR